MNVEGISRYDFEIFNGQFEEEPDCHLFPILPLDDYFLDKKKQVRMDKNRRAWMLRRTMLRYLL